MQNPKWGLDNLRDNVSVVNGKIGVTEAARFDNGVLHCSFVIDSTTEFIPPGIASYYID